MNAGMYDGYYGFREAPFSLTPDPKFAYASKSHEQALQTILRALGRHEGLIVVTGDIGCGKTTLCRRLLPLLPERTFLSLILNPFLDADDLLKQVLEDYGLISAEELRRGSLARATCHDLARTLQEFANSLAQIKGTAVIIIDEAQHLPLRTLEQIRLLSNFETDTTKLLQIILVGQSELEPILRLDEMRQLNQRISRRIRIEPLPAHEVAPYVQHRLSTALSASSLPAVHFTASALAALAPLSRGVPRIINLLCDRALEMGHVSGATAIDRKLVLAAAEDLELPVPRSVRLAAVNTPRVIQGVAAAAVIAAAASAVFATRGTWSNWFAAPSPAPTAQAMAEPATQSAAQSAAQPVRPAAQAPSAAAVPPAAAERIELESATLPPAIVRATTSYEMVVASFATANRARAAATDLIAQGHPARVTTSTSGEWQMVIVGPYTTLAEANEAKNTLEKLGFSGIKITNSR